MRTAQIPVHHIVLPSYLHRVELDEEALTQLMRSIESEGLINPISVSQVDGAYRLEAGHRRLVAHQRLHRHEIRATVYEPVDQVSGTRIRVAENLQRSDLTPMEEARALALALDELKISTAELARTVHRSQDWVEQRLSLLDLPDELGALVHQRRLVTGAALVLARVTDEPHRIYLTRYALDAGATVQTLRDWVQQWLLHAESGAAGAAPRPEPFVPGQPVIIQIPCYVCSDPYAHEHMRILRVCPRCAATIANAGAPQHKPLDGHWTVTDAD